MRFPILCVLLVVGGTSLVAFAGCHRGFYRRQADREAQALIQQKACDPRWNLPDSSIEIPASSRMFDPFSIDHPPLPPDDPTSHQLMQRVDDKPGFPHWHANGDTNHVENPEWIAHLPVNENGEVEMDIATAYRLALLHSTDYQQQRETLYLSALDVSLQRFGFDSQLFSGFNAFVENNGALSSSGSSTTLETSLGNQGLRLQKLGITGSTLVIGLANSMIWQFAGPNTQTASTLIDFSIIQPLLQGGGRDRIMESLTQAERTLLANVRQMERYRRGFYLQVVIGRNPGQGPSRGGNFLGAPGNAPTGAGGMLGILQSQQQIRIQKYQVNSLKNVLEQFEARKEAGLIDSLQVAQTQTQLYNAQNGLLRSKTNYQRSLDNFKQQLSLPPDLPIVIKDPILDQFELFDDENTIRQQEIESLTKVVGNELSELNKIIVDSGIKDDEKKIVGLKWTKELKDALTKFKSTYQKIAPIAKKLRDADAIRVAKDFDKFEAVRADRIKDLEGLRKFIEKMSEKGGRYSIDQDLLMDAGKDVEYDPNADEVLIDVAVLARVPELRDQLKEILESEQQLPRVEKEIETLATQLDALIKLESIDEGDRAQTARLLAQVKTELLDLIPQILTDLNGLSIDLSLLQARARVDSISVPKVDISDIEAIKIAREFRRDWMNARANLVDQWRQIEFVADDLESTLDLVLSGSVNNTSSNPFSVRAETGTIRGGFQFDTPYTRISERNTYRQTLIQYQQTKRQYYEYEDAIKANLRNIMREIALNRVLFEINRRGLKVSISQVEEARLRLSAPERPGAGRSSTLSRDLTDAIGNLQGDQTRFLGVWVNLESLRRNLDFDLGTMQLDEEGYWVDPGQFDATIAARVAAKYGLECDPLTNELIMVPNQAPAEDEGSSLERRSGTPVSQRGSLLRRRPAPSSVRGASDSDSRARANAGFQPRLLRRWYATPEGVDQVDVAEMNARFDQKATSRSESTASNDSRALIRNPLKIRGRRPRAAKLESLPGMESETKRR